MALLRNSLRRFSTFAKKTVHIKLWASAVPAKNWATSKVYDIMILLWNRGALGVDSSKEKENKVFSETPQHTYIF